MHKPTLRAARVVVVVALAIGGYFLFIRTSHLDRSQLGVLAVRHTTLPALKAKRPGSSQSVSPSQSTFAVVREAARTAPDQTGLYERQWYRSSSSPPQVGLLLDLLPDASKAQLALQDAVKLLSKAPSIGSDTGSRPRRFKVSSISGSSGISYLLSHGSTAGGYSYTVDFRVGRVVVSELIVNPETTYSTRWAVADAEAENTLLQRVEPGFSLYRTTTPVLATVIYFVICAIVAAAAFFGPELALGLRERQHERRAAREEDRIRSQYRARGRRAVQRHKAPAWRQSKHR